MLRLIVLILGAVYWQRADLQSVSVRSSSFKTYEYPTATFTDRFRRVNQSIAQYPSYHLWAGRGHLSITAHSCVINRNETKIQFRTYTMQNAVKDTVGKVSVSTLMKTEEASFYAVANAVLEDTLEHMLDMAVRLPRSSAEQAAFAAQALARVDRTRLCLSGGQQ